MALSRKKKTVLLTDIMSRNMCLMVIILQLNIVCLAHEDFLLNANEENNPMSNSKFSSGN